MSPQHKELLGILEKKASMEKVIEYLHELNFEFVDVDHLEREAPKVQLAQKFHRRFSFMGHRYLVENSTRLNYDFLIGIRFLDIRSPSYLLYINGQFINSYNKPWKKAVEFNTKKKKVLVRYPDFMSIQDRIDWRKYHKKFRAKKLFDLEKLAWYLKCRIHIQNLDKEDEHLN